jgi:hypothetical protein
MGGDASVRGQILSTSSPFITLLVILAVITGLLLFAFLAWVRFRKRGSNVEERTIYGRLAEEDVVVVCQDGSLPSLRTDILPKGGEFSDFELGSRSPPEISVPGSVIIGLTSGRKENADIDVALTSDDSHSAAQVRFQNFASINGDLSVEALISAHKGLVEQRERFLLDARNVGLRHMALSHLKIQQKFEKQIMEFKTSQIKINK